MPLPGALSILNVPLSEDTREPYIRDAHASILNIVEHEATAIITISQYYITTLHSKGSISIFEHLECFSELFITTRHTIDDNLDIGVEALGTEPSFES